MTRKRVAKGYPRPDKVRNPYAASLFKTKWFGRRIIRDKRTRILRDLDKGAANENYIEESSS